MKLHEILTLPEVLSGEKWFVPADWLPCPVAFFIHDGIVSTVRRGDSGITPYASVLAGDWVAVDPSVILDYAEKLRVAG